jgi:hypothetical protein
MKNRKGKQKIRQNKNCLFPSTVQVKNKMCNTTYGRDDIIMPDNATPSDRDGKYGAGKKAY